MAWERPLPPRLLRAPLPSRAGLPPRNAPAGEGVPNLLFVADWEIPLPHRLRAGAVTATATIRGSQDEEYAWQRVPDSPNPPPCLLKKMFLKSLRWRLKGVARRKAFSSPWRRVLHMKIGRRSFLFSLHDRDLDAALDDAYRDVRDELSPPAPHEMR